MTKVNDIKGFGMMHKRQRGFTLIELMIVVGIIAILAAFVYPQYQKYIAKSRRSDGKAMLTAIAAREEQYFLDNKSYTSTLSNLSYTANSDGTVSSEHGFYNVRAAATATSFALTAVPQGTQQSDTACGNLTLNEKGEKGQSGSATDCW